MYNLCGESFALILKGKSGMTDSSTTRANIVALLVILTVSAATMLWLLWRFPLTTAIITLLVLATLGILARLARSSDVEIADLDRSKQII
jgi:hypothetical protein